jgi:ribosomal protein L37E
MTGQEWEALRERHQKCPSTSVARLPQKEAATKVEGRCHMPGTQCAHIQEFSCSSCGFGWAEEQRYVEGVFA